MTFSIFNYSEEITEEAKRESKKTDEVIPDSIVTINRDMQPTNGIGDFQITS